MESMAQTIITDFEILFEKKNIPFLIIDQKLKIIKKSTDFLDLLGMVIENPFEGMLLSVFFLAEKPVVGTHENVHFDSKKEFQNIKLILKQNTSRTFFVQVYGFFDDHMPMYLLAFEEIGPDLPLFEIDLNSLNRMRMIVEYIPFGIFVKDIRNNFSYIVWNKKCEAIYGVESAGVIGVTDFEVFDGETAARYRQIDNEVIQTKKMVKVPSKTIENKNGQMIVNYIKLPLLNENGEVWGILGAIEDETEYLRIQNALKLSENRYQALVENISDFVWEIDKENQHTYVSPRIKDLLGYEVGEILGTEISFLMAEEQNIFARERFLKSIAEKKEIKNLEIQLINKNGEIVFVETNAMPIYDEKGMFRGFLGADRDISRRKEAEKSLKDAFENEKNLNDMRRHFVTMTSHEFRTPLSAILSSAELLEHYGENWEPEKRLEHYKKIQLFSHRLNQMLSEILTYGKLNVNKSIDPLQKLDIVKFCENVISEIRSADNYQHTIYLVMKGEDHNLLCDDNQLKTILLNLLSNAIKYSKPDTDIIVDLDNTQTDYVLQVIDQGFGIPDEDLEKIFEPFTRGINVSGIPGTGLGLTIVKKIVEILDGRIEVLSEPDSGSTFTIYLPKTGINT